MGSTVLQFVVEAHECANGCCFNGVLTGEFEGNEISLVSKAIFKTEAEAIDFVVTNMHDPESPLSIQLVRKLENIGGFVISGQEFLDKAPPLSVIQGGKS